MLAATSPSPVLRPDSPRLAQDSSTFRPILIAIDPSPVGMHATLVGLQLAAALSAEVAFIRVIEPAISDAAWFAVAAPELLQSPDDEITRILTALTPLVFIPAQAVKFFPVGNAVEAIPQAAQDWSADLVVIGSHGLDGVERILLGSVAEGVARHAPCPVLVVRKPPDGQWAEPVSSLQ